MSRYELLQWVNTTVKGEYKKIEELCSGVAYCQILEVLHPNCISKRKLKLNAKLEHEYLYNMKLFQAAFSQLHIDKIVPVDRIIKGRFQDNFEFLQWLKRFFDSNTVGKENFKLEVPTTTTEKKTPKSVRKATYSKTAREGITSKKSIADVKASVSSARAAINSVTKINARNGKGNNVEIGKGNNAEIVKSKHARNDEGNEIKTGKSRDVGKNVSNAAENDVQLDNIAEIPSVSALPVKENVSAAIKSEPASPEDSDPTSPKISTNLMDTMQEKLSKLKEEGEKLEDILQQGSKLKMNLAEERDYYCSKVKLIEEIALSHPENALCHRILDVVQQSKNTMREIAEQHSGDGDK